MAGFLPKWRKALTQLLTVFRSDELLYLLFNKEATPLCLHLHLKREEGKIPRLLVWCGLSLLLLLLYTDPLPIVTVALIHSAGAYLQFFCSYKTLAHTHLQSATLAYWVELTH